jgi:HK97 family phage major capsid protein
VTRDTASHFKLNDMAGMYAKLLPGGSPNSVTWVMHPTVLPDLITMTGGDNVIFLNNDIHGMPRMTVLGKDVVITEKVPALGTDNCVSLNDFSQYLIGDRQQVEIAFSEHVAFLNNQSVWRFVSRVGGMPWLRDKITLQDATSTLTPFVGLTQ